MGEKRVDVRYVSPNVQTHPSSLVKSLESVEVLSIRNSGFDEYIRAKIKVKDGELAGRIFFTKQLKSPIEEYSPDVFSETEIAAYKRKDEERDKSLSPQAMVVAKLNEEGKMSMIEPIHVLEPRQLSCNIDALKRKKTV